MPQDYKEIEKEFKKIVSDHGCNSCWSDGGDCTCNHERMAMEDIFPFIITKLTEQREKILNKIPPNRSKYHEDNLYMKGQDDAYDFIRKLLK